LPAAIKKGRMLRTFVRTVGTPSVIVSLVSVLFLLYLLYEEKPPPIWSERCVAWKKSKNDCDRCCAAYSQNRWVPSAIAKVLLLLHFLRRACMGSFHGVLDESLRVFLVGALTIPTIWLLPAHSKWVPGVLDVAGLCMYFVAFVCCLFVRSSSKRRAFFELLCWCGSSTLVLSNVPRIYDTLDVGSNNSSSNSSFLRYVPLLLGLFCVSSICIVAQEESVKDKDKKQN
jgi:hypothetical protein